MNQPSSRLTEIFLGRRLIPGTFEGLFMNSVFASFFFLSFSLFFLRVLPLYFFFFHPFVILGLVCDYFIFFGNKFSLPTYIFTDILV